MTRHPCATVVCPALLAGASLFAACNATPEGRSPEDVAAPSGTTPATATPSVTATATPPSSATAAAECGVDKDCGCGTDRATGKCAFGPILQIDESKQCPDFCSGVAGDLHIACREGHCTQVSRKRPRIPKLE